MIPILYPKTELQFDTNGLGALSDAITCVVTEERNGSYELEMTYPVKGRHYGDIELETIIYAQPADGKDPQPFQVYKISTPINDIVTISAQHISYRLSFVPVSPLTSIGAIETLYGLKTNSIVRHPFEVWTDMRNTESKFSRSYPSSFRECLGGSDGSFLDVFGGEIEWDKFKVKLHQHRGSDTGVRIAYSKNITDYKNEEANDGLITAVYPYWINSETSELVTCGIVYAIKKEGYNAVTGESAPEWVSGTYYKVKTTGYYQNDEDWAPVWIENKYYRIKKSGYYNVEDERVPTWEPNKYYSVLPYGFFNVTGDSAPDFAYETYYENTSSIYTRLTEVSAPTWVKNTYYKNGGTESDPHYILTEEEPSDWNTNYNDYFIEEDTQFELLTSKPYDWTENYFSYYTYKAPEYVLTESIPSDWSTNYKGYYTYYKFDENNLIYILTTAEPDDWHTNFNDYYIYYEPVEGKTEYSVTTEEPNDWSTTYASYFTHWTERYSDDHPYSRVVSKDFSSDFKNRPTERMLKRAGSDYINSTTLTSNSENLTVSFVALWQTEEYKNIAPLERVNLCDTVTVDFKEENSVNSVKLKVIKTTYDVLAERYSSVELGNSKSSLSNTICSINDAIQEAVSETTSTLQSSLAYQAKLLNGGLGGNVKINYNAKNRPCEIIVGDSDDISKMTNCLRINYMGVGFSKNGYSGPYTSIWGIDGEFDAQCIKAGTIDGGKIKAGTIQADSLTMAARDDLLSKVNEEMSKLRDEIPDISDLAGWLRVEDGHLYIGDANSNLIIVQGSFSDKDGTVYQKISFMDTSFNPPKELAYIANNHFYTTDLMLGLYKVSGSDDPNKGISFRWASSV